MIKLNRQLIVDTLKDKGWTESKFALEMKLKAAKLKLPNQPESYTSYVSYVMGGKFTPKMDRMILMADTLGIKRKSIWEMEK